MNNDSVDLTMNDSVLNVRSFDHMTLVVADVEASRNFYVGFLGMSEVERPGFEFPGAWFQLGAVQIHVTKSDPDSGMAGWGDRNPLRISRGHHFAFEVDRVEECLDSLNQHGIEILSGPKQRPDGPTQVYIADPDGHLVELYSKN